MRSQRGISGGTPPRFCESLRRDSIRACLPLVADQIDVALLGGAHTIGPALLREVESSDWATKEVQLKPRRQS